MLLLFLQFIKQYDTEDLMDIVLPRLAKVVTLWEFLMMKVESTNTNKPNIQSVYQEFELLTEKVKDLFKTCLKLSDGKSDESIDNRMKVINVTSFPNSMQIKVSATVKVLLCLGINFRGLSKINIFVGSLNMDLSFLKEKKNKERI